jgi:hypothetical protein
MQKMGCLFIRLTLCNNNFIKAIFVTPKLQKFGSYEKKFYTALAVFTALIFVANWHHTNQQGIFDNEYTPLAKHLLSGDGYVIHSGSKILYPIWGYSFLTMFGEFIGSSIFFLALVQAILCIVGIYFFYKLFNLEKKYWHILLFSPFIALMSVRWPDAIVAVLLIIAAYYLKICLETQSRKYAIITGLLLGILLNFRSEYLGLLLVLAVIAIVSLFFKKKYFFSNLTLIAFFALLLLLPWAFYSYSIDKHFRLTATNGGGVLYISLGQLPNNPWGIVHSDSVAFTVAKENGIDDPYSAQGDSLLTAKFIHDVEKKPVAYSEKIGYNVFTSFIRGVYVGEYPDIIEKTIKIIFVFIFDLLLALSVYTLVKKIKASSIFTAVSVLIIYKFALISFIQYEPRHMNAIYLFMLGIAFVYKRSKKFSKDSEHGISSKKNFN